MKAIKNINFGSLALAGFVGAYAMFFVDLWFDGFLGLFGAFPGTSNAWWMLEHHIDGIIFALPFAWPALYYRLPKNKIAKGLSYGLIWTIAVGIVSLIAGALGAARFNQMPMNAAAFISNLLLHLVWGFFLGVIYTPPKTEAEYATERHEAQREAEPERRESPATEPAQ